jgi:hypothetical protein
MSPGAVITFLFSAALFAAVHRFAVLTSLYWYYWWFDIVMHFWGGLLIGLGVHVFSGYSRFPIKPTFKSVVLILAVIIGAWELFEYIVGLSDPAIHLVDTVEDVLLGFSGGLLSHFLLKAYTMKKL